MITALLLHLLIIKGVLFLRTVVTFEILLYQMPFRICYYRDETYFILKLTDNLSLCYCYFSLKQKTYVVDVQEW